MLWQFLSALGVVFLFLSLFFVSTVVLCRLLLSGKDEPLYTVIPGAENDERLVQKAFAAFLQINLFTFFKKNTIVVLDFGVSEQIKRECCELLGEQNVLFCTREDFDRIMDGGY